MTTTPFTDYIQESTATMISEAGLSRLLSRIDTDNELAIITAYRQNFSKRENIARNRALRGVLNKNKMGAYQLVGHWQECSDPNVEYSDCPKNQLVDAVERSYLVMKPEGMNEDTFKKILVELTRKYDQDGIVYRSGGKYVILNKSGRVEFSIGSGVSIGKIAQGYSQHVKKLNVPFVFEGLETPMTNIGKMIWKHRGMKYLPLTEAEMAE